MVNHSVFTKKYQLVYFVLVLTFFALPVVAQNDVSSQEAVKSDYSNAYAEQILAPIALYPDSLLTHILISSTYPIEVVEAERWLDKNERFSKEDALDAVAEFEWDPSVKALVAFPNVLKKLSEELNWTYQLGNLFLSYESEVLASIQALRAKAEQAGNLSQLEHMNIEKENNTIVITSREPDVIYVPYYDTRVIYGGWHWHSYPPIFWHRPHYYYRHVYSSPYYFHTGIFISRNYFYSDIHWHSRHVVVVNHYNKRRHYSSGKLTHHKNANRWHHSKAHRKGVDYRVKVSSHSSRAHTIKGKNHQRIDNNSPRVSHSATKSYQKNTAYAVNSHTNKARHQTEIKRQSVKQSLSTSAHKSYSSSAKQKSYSVSTSASNSAKKYNSSYQSNRKNHYDDRSLANKSASRTAIKTQSSSYQKNSNSRYNSAAKQKTYRATKSRSHTPNKNYATPSSLNKSYTSSHRGGASSSKRSASGRSKNH